MSEATPTQQGGEIEFTPAYQGRMAAMAQIAKQAHAAVAGELSDFDEDTGEITPRHAEPKAEEPKQETQAEQEAQQEAQQEETQAAQDERAEDQPKPRMVSIVVDGRAIEVAEDKILEAGKRTLQKESAADRRLQEAVAKERQAQQLLEQAKRLSNQDADDPHSTPSQDASNTTQATKGLDPEALDALLENKLYMRDAQKALEKFKQDFPEIVSDPHLIRLAGDLEQDRLDAATALGESFGDPYDAYRKHGESIRDWLKKRAPVAQPVNADKVEKKRSIMAVPAVNATAPKPQEKKPLTVSEQIEAMREARLKGRPVNH